MQFAFPHRVVDYTRFLGKANTLGLNATMCALDSGNDYLEITAPLRNGESVTILLSIRERGVYFSLGNRFKLVRSEDLIGPLLRFVAGSKSRSLAELQDSLDEILDTPWLTYSQWQEENWAELRRAYTTCGWRFPEIRGAQECLAIYSRCLSNGPKTPLGKVIDDSNNRLTWNVKHAFRKQTEAIIADETELVKGVLWVMQQIVPPGQSMMVYERNRHPKLFFPHMGRPDALLNYWATQLLPLESDFAFLDPGCSFGYSGDYLSGTVTAFGEKFVSSLLPLKLKLLQRPVHVQPLTLEAWGQSNSKWMKFGWNRLSETELTGVRDKLREVTTDIDIDPISPSRSWNISEITDDDIESALRVESLLLSKLAVAMQRCSYADSEWYSWSEPYPICRLGLPLKFSAHELSSWAVPLLSRYSNSCSVRSDFTNGVICLNRTGQLIVFGDELLSRVDQDFGGDLGVKP